MEETSSATRLAEPSYQYSVGTATILLKLKAEVELFLGRDYL